MTPERKKEVFSIIQERALSFIESEIRNDGHYDDLIECDELMTYEEFWKVTDSMVVKVEISLVS